jgi:acetyl-CoA C-acetyltransferase
MSIPSKKQARFVNEDEHPSPNVSFEAPARLKPVFDPEGGITAGNSSGLNDGAAAVLVVSERELHARRMKPLARIASYACAVVEPMDMRLGPVEASRKVLEKGWLAWN